MGADRQGSPTEEGSGTRLRRTWQVVPLLGVRSLGAQIFDYLPFGKSSPEAEPGRLVRVPFGKRQVVGVVVGGGDAADLSGIRLRPVSEVLPWRLSEEAQALARALADYYLAPLGAAFAAVTPSSWLAPYRCAGRAVTWVVPLAGPEAGDALTCRQKEVLAALPSDGAPVADVCRSLGCTRGVLEALVRAGAASFELRRIPSRPRSGGVTRATVVPFSPVEVLTRDQEQALATLRAMLEQGEMQHVLLWGVTGSGKTEVYVRLVESTLAAGRSAIVLVPEIALTDALEAYLRARLGAETVAVIHSDLGHAARARVMEAIQQGLCRVVVGPRSAVFAPVRDLGLVVIDESHDPSYKNEEEPRYNARWVAKWRAQYHRALLVEVTATPRLETLVESSRTIRLRSRPPGSVLPEIEIVDMRRQGAAGALSPRAATLLRDVLGKSGQAVLLVNRRGHSVFVFCPLCGHVLFCPQCDISLTLHRAGRGSYGRVLRCHHCGYTESEPSVCPQCGAATLARGGAGTQRLEEELARFLPNDHIFRLDSDVASSAGRAWEVLRKFSQTRPAVLVGTQMIAKGHDFPLVSLVIVVDADTGLYIPDFRAAERTFQLIRQVVGRAGRRSIRGIAVVQTWNPDSPCIRMAVTGEERAFYERELLERKRLGLPPATRLAGLIAVGPQGKAEHAAVTIAHCSERIMGPASVRGPARLPRLRGRERWLVTVSATWERPWPPASLSEEIFRLRSDFARKGVDLVVDVDPERLS